MAEDRRDGDESTIAGLARAQRRRFSDLGDSLPDLPLVGRLGEDGGEEVTEADVVEAYVRETEARAHEEEAERLVDALVAAGLDQQDAEAAVAEDRVPLALASQALGEAPRYTRREIADASGLPESLLEELDRAAGFSRVERFTQSDLDTSHLVAQLLELIPQEAVMRSTRARAQSIAAIVRSDMALIRDELVRPMRQAGADDLTLAVALAEHAADFERISRRLLVNGYQRQVRETLGAELSTLAARSDDAAVVAAVAFVDLVGYTALAARVDPVGLDELLDEFETRVVDVVAEADGVSVVKYLGDAAMLVAADLHALTDVLLEITEPQGLDEVPIRGGLAKGEVLLREGDFFGTPVNLAARLTDLARPWTVLADDDLRDELRERYGTRRIRPVHLRGVGMRRPISIRGRNVEDDEDATVE